MSRLIDAEQAVFDLTHYRDNDGNTHPMVREEVFTTTQIVEWLKLQPTVGAVDRKLFEKVCEFLSDTQPDWICEEMCDIDHEYCVNTCEYLEIPLTCIERYARLKMDEVT